MVVRERVCTDEDNGLKWCEFDAVVGVYWSINRAEEVADASAQALLDAGANKGDYRFTVKVSTYYYE